MLEFMTMAVLLVVGAMGGAVVGIWLAMPTKPHAWVVVESWDANPAGMFATPADAQAYIRNAKAMGNADAADWVVRGVVLLRQQGDPR